MPNTDKTIKFRIVKTACDTWNIEKYSKGWFKWKWRIVINPDARCDPDVGYSCDKYNMYSQAQAEKNLKRILARRKFKSQVIKVVEELG